MSDSTMKSPCVGVCTMDANDTCLGCNRTMPEIANWMRMTEEQRQEIMKRESVNKD